MNPTTATAPSSYDLQARAFLDSHGIKCRITLKDQKPAPWSDEDKDNRPRNRYSVTLWRVKERESDVFTYRAKDMIGYQTEGTFCGHINHPQRLTFQFWGSIADAEKGEHPSAYDVLACVSSDANTPETFKDFCSDYGYDEDSRRTFALFKRCDRFARRIRAFFTDAEREELAEIN